MAQSPKSRRAGSKTRVRRSAPTIGIIIGHAGLPQELRRAALSIVPDREGLEVVSNGDEPAEELDRRLATIADRHPDSPILVFADMCGTSCCHAAARLRRLRSNVEMVNGVNLPMLIRFLQYRTRKNTGELVRLMHRAAKQGTRPV